MNKYFRYLPNSCLFALLLISAPALTFANYEADAKYAENAPPVISHRIGVDVNGEACLVCHKTGVNKAPLSPHPIRLNCTQCHVRSDLSEPAAPAKKGKKKK